MSCWENDGDYLYVYSFSNDIEHERSMIFAFWEGIQSLDCNKNTVKAQERLCVIVIVF